MRAGDYDEARARLDDAIADDNAVLSRQPDDPIAPIERAKAEMLKGDFSSAAADCEQRETMFPGDQACATSRLSSWS